MLANDCRLTLYLKPEKVSTAEIFSFFFFSFHTNILSKFCIRKTTKLTILHSYLMEVVVVVVVVVV